jgi:hypothetical protein
MPNGVHTGKSVTEPQRSQVILALASGESPHSIAKRSGLSPMIVQAVRDAEWDEISARKPILAAMAERNALLAADQIGDALAKRKYPIGSLPVVFGVSVDKAINLRADPTASIQQHLHLHLSQNNVTANFNQLLQRLEDKCASSQPTEVVITAQDASDNSHARAEKEATLVRAKARRKAGKRHDDAT